MEDRPAEDLERWTRPEGNIVSIGFARLDETITDYLSECRDNGLAASTVDRYEISLRKLQRDVQDVYGDKLGRDPVLRSLPVLVWRDWIVKHYATAAPKTFNREMSGVRAFLNWAYDCNRLDRTKRHLGKLKERPNEVVTPKLWVTEAQLPEIEAAARRWHVRDAAFVVTLFYTMRRAGELTSLRVKDFDLRERPDAPDGRLIWVNHKGRGRHRTYSLPPRLRPALVEWFATYAALMHVDQLDPEWFAFPALRVAKGDVVVRGSRRLMELDPAKPIGDPSGIVRKALTAAGMRIPGNACHAFRRGGAREAYDRLAAAGHPNPLRIVMVLLDHRSEQQTETYLGVEKDRIEAGRALASVFPDTPAGGPEAAGGGSEADDLMADLLDLMATRKMPGKRVA